MREIKDAEDLERATVYMLKAPQRAYEVNYLKEWTHPVTGEVRPAGWHQQKDWMGTGNFVRMLDVLGDRSLDHLLFGNGEGTPLVRAIRHEALARFRIWERQQPWAKAA